jgi:glutamate-1-semialdehyde 2,1-aminomutase/spore coat polysaccharide biosynthesis protein SpsF
MATACIVQARLGSTRLPAKVLLPLPTGRTVIQEVIHRCHQIPGVDYIVVAIPDTPENVILARHIGMAAPYIAGPEHDVLARYVVAVRSVPNCDVVMRITADCPLIDPQVCGRVLAKFNEDGLGYCSNTIRRSWPKGLDCEVFSRAWLEMADKQATEPSDREHVCTIMHRFPHVQQVTTVPDRSHLLWTLDTMEDYVRIWRLFEDRLRDEACR